MKKTASFFYFLFSIAHSLFSQNTGIGTTTPVLGKLEVFGAAGSGYTSGIFGSDGAGISLERNFPTIGFNQYNNGESRFMATGYAAFQYLDPSSGTMSFGMLGNGNQDALATSVIRVLSIGSNGNVGIKTDPVNASLYVIKAGNFDGAAVFGGTSYNSHFYYGTEEHTYIRGGYTGSYVYLNDIEIGNVILGGGNSTVGINSGDPVYTLEIRQYNGKGLLLIDPAGGFNNWEYLVHALSGGTGNSELSLFYNGAIKGYFSPATGEYFVYSSDRRVKTNIKSLSPVLRKMMQLRPSIYEMKSNNPMHQKTIGFIAQEVKFLFPQLVEIKENKVDTINRIPDLYSLNYNGFSIVAIKALQEQMEQIKVLQKENEKLMKRLEALERKIAK